MCFQVVPCRHATTTPIQPRPPCRASAARRQTAQEAPNIAPRRPKRLPRGPTAAKRPHGGQGRRPAIRPPYPHPSPRRSMVIPPPPTFLTLLPFPVLSRPTSNPLPSNLLSRLRCLVPSLPTFSSPLTAVLCLLCLRPCPHSCPSHRLHQRPHFTLSTLSRRLQAHGIIDTYGSAPTVSCYFCAS